MFNKECKKTMGHFIFRWNQSLKPWFETKVLSGQLKTGFSTSSEFRIKLGFKPKFQTKV